MNPLVSEMLGVSARNDLEVTFLEELLNDDCKCESSHTESQCSYDPSQLVITGCSNHRWIVCTNSATNVRTRQSETPCGYCFDLVRDCWTIRPI